MSGKGCNSVVRAEKILTYIAYVGAASFMELIKEFQYPKSSLLNLLNVMVECGFLIKNERGQYSLGIKNYELGCQALHRKNIFEVTKRPMQELSLKSGLVCHLGAMENYYAIYLDKVESPDSVPTRKSWIGKKLELHITALGKALLAWKTQEEMDYFLDALILKKHTQNTLTDKKLFRGELQKTRLRGWAIDNEESTYGAVCLSMPIFNMYNRVNYAISLSGNPVIFSGNKTDDYLELLRQCAEQISYGLGYRNTFEYFRKGN
ncbi:IclR family transcriptional regulator [Brenneria goodwinii]|uniref:IclR family transcriptional regulator n=1 Tax=Brenneria goodwinii TaxID=1109412 RepID=A0AAE8EKI3_9GAMM|nr:IclR family transcriptional regulator [Brenneria goodwinii]ATA23640.1 IclR family transcriptional regulator [Brenneria goodwinii]MCG8154718.1 IclR family transcriptional regulator [Brenneria goodwinii]MCG8159945.1 IclR family transcriptional regulator [Brenneria goodwinii]MCG8163956.1 IclR family transcriptional regulator [Brenneria goodwinii]MCG8168565.1 IclR family transcriptional regulator [Brenneria goodwinii]